MKKFLILACLFVCYHGSSVAAEQSPNIVMIFCDDLTNQALSCYGNSLKLLETPNIDRLAEEGMLFRRCMVPNSYMWSKSSCDLDWQVRARKWFLL